MALLLSQQTQAGVGHLLRQLRRFRDLTLDQLADRTGLSVAALSRYENGVRHPSLEILARLLKALADGKGRS